MFQIGRIIAGSAPFLGQGARGAVAEYAAREETAVQLMVITGCDKNRADEAIAEYAREMPYPDWPRFTSRMAEIFLSNGRATKDITTNHKESK